MNEAEARDLRQSHDRYVREVSRKSKAALADIYRQRLARQGYQLLYGGPASKDELISAIVSQDFPVEKLNEAIHVLYHGEWSNSACEHCHPRHADAMTGRCDCSLGKVTA